MQLNSAALGARIDNVLDVALEQQRIVGAVLMIAHEGEILYQRAAGMADRESGRPMQLDTLFRLSSVTKPIVSATALALVARGKLALDDGVDKWLPEFQPQLPSGGAATITVRQLLTHTAGLAYSFHEPADGPYHRAGISDGLDQPGLDFAENLRRIASVPLLRPPGTAWQYSLALDVLGAVIERAHGTSLPLATSELVTEPLSMHDTAFRVVDAARLAAPYVDGTPPSRMNDPHVIPFGTGAGISYSPSRAFNERSFPSGGTGMTGSTPEILRFLECVRRGGEPILPPQLAAAMMENQIGELAGHQPGWGFGFGGAVLRDPVLAQTPHTSGTWLWGGVYGHSWFVDPAAKLTVVLLTNTALEGMIGRVTVDLRDAVYESTRSDAAKPSRQE
jgi:CubicO group peptidase (beta-lactamase class C family)